MPFVAQLLHHFLALIDDHHHHAAVAQLVDDAGGNAAVTAHHDVVAQLLEPLHQVHHPLDAAFDDRAQRHRQGRDEQRHANEIHRDREPPRVGGGRIDLGDVEVVAQGDVGYQREVRRIGPPVDAAELLPQQIGADHAVDQRQHDGDPGHHLPVAVTARGAHGELPVERQQPGDHQQRRQVGEDAFSLEYAICNGWQGCRGQRQGGAPGPAPALQQAPAEQHQEDAEEAEQDADYLGAAVRISRRGVGSSCSRGAAGAKFDRARRHQQQEPHEQEQQAVEPDHHRQHGGGARPPQPAARGLVRRPIPGTNEH